MALTSQPILVKLEKNLDEIVKFYRILLDVVRKEKQILISADLDQLNDNNKQKESVLLKIRGLENIRIKHVKELANREGIKEEQPRLLDIANHFQGDTGDRLRNLHSVLNLLLKRVQDLNAKNAVLVESALQNLSGAMNDVKTKLNDKPTYKKQGVIGYGESSQAHFVSKEV